MLTKTDLSQIRKIVQKETTPIKKDVKAVKSDVAQTRKDIKTIVGFFDKEYLELRARVERIEQHLGFSSP